MPEQIHHLRAVDWHSLLVSVRHRFLLVHPPVLECEVLLLAELGQFLFVFVIAVVVDQELGAADGVVKVAVLVLHHVDEDLGLLLGEGGDDWHELAELFLVRLVLLVRCFRLQVHELYHVLEGFGLGVSLLEERLRDVVLVIELSDLLFWVELQIVVLVIQRAIQFGEKIKLLLSELRLWQLLTFMQLEWESKQLLLIR